MISATEIDAFWCVLIYYFDQIKSKKSNIINYKNKNNLFWNTYE